MLSPLDFYPDIELVLIMIIVPTFLNGFSYWVIDSFISARKKPVDSCSDESREGNGEGSGIEEKVKEDSEISPLLSHRSA